MKIRIQFKKDNKKERAQDFLNHLNRVQAIRMPDWRDMDKGKMTWYRVSSSESMVLFTVARLYTPVAIYMEK